MYRDPSSTHELTIARLEAEIRDLQALGGRRREQRLIVATLLSVVFGVFALVACVDARERETFIRQLHEDETNRCAERLTACTTWAESTCAPSATMKQVADEAAQVTETETDDNLSR